MIKQLLDSIQPLNHSAMEAAGRRLDSLAKPIGSLGLLEAYAVRLAGISGGKVDVTKKALLVFCADNGVCDEGIGSAPQSVTLSQCDNLVRGITGAGVLARRFGAEMIVCDVGMRTPSHLKQVRQLSVRAGTGNIRVEDAMTRQEAETALLRGADVAQECARRGVQVIGVGEMGIGNTTTSSAVLAALTGIDPDRLIGRGGGINSAMLQKKQTVIHDALARANASAQDVIGVLAKLGGLDICAMAGAYLGAAAAGIPAVIDGFIGNVAALAACRLCPAVREYLFASHLSQEPGAVIALEAVGLQAPLRMQMRLGEGSGCPLLFQLLEAAAAIYNQMGTFAEAGIDNSYLEELKEKPCGC